MGSSVVEVLRIARVASGHKGTHHWIQHQPVGERARVASDFRRQRGIFGHPRDPRGRRSDSVRPDETDPFRTRCATQITLLMTFRSRRAAGSLHSQAFSYPSPRNRRGPGQSQEPLSPRQSRAGLTRLDREVTFPVSRGGIHFAGSFPVFVRASLSTGGFRHVDPGPPLPVNPDGRSGRRSARTRSDQG